MREEIRVEMEKVVKEYEAFFEEVDDIEEAKSRIRSMRPYLWM